MKSQTRESVLSVAKTAKIEKGSGSKLNKVIKMLKVS